MKEEQEINNPNEGNSNASDDNSTPIYTTGNSTLQTPDEAKRDKSNKPGQNDKIDVSNTDLRQTNNDRMAGSDRAGTAERKPQDM